MADHKGLAQEFRRRFQTGLTVRHGKKGTGEITFTPNKANAKNFYPGSLQSNWLKNNAKRYGLHAVGASQSPPNANLYLALPEKETPPNPETPSATTE